MRSTSKKSTRKRWHWVIPLVLLLALAAAVRAVALHRPFDSPATADPGRSNPTNPDGSAEEQPPLHTLPELQTFLVMGVDSMEGEWGRSDSLMVVSYNPREQRVAMLSIPRDLWTYIPGRGYDKINHAYAFGGPTLSVETVERLLGMDIDHWVSISFDGFVEVIDALGGVEVNPPEPLYYVDPADRRFGPEGLVIDIQAGPQVMDGLTALKYARFRSDSQGDVGRMRRQQEIIQAAMKKAASPALFARAGQLIPALYHTIGTDMTVGEMLKLATTGRQALTKSPVTGTIEADEYWIDGVFYFGADLVKLRSTAYELLVGEPPGEDFLARAQADNQEYQSVLQREVARSQAAAAARAEEEAANSDGESGETVADPTGDGLGGDAAEGPDGTADETAGAWASVYVVDATGQGAAWDYVAGLEAAGMRVRVHESQAVLSVTMALVRDPELDEESVRQRLESVIPGVVIRMAPDPTAADDIDLVLGTNVLGD
ncbi:LCP family protein [Symbiobacterium thermophilum]|uniref:LytR family transcriptional regulator n=1 Tax=Symbiobacterium thermophilum (strain DSM 24528 / JCM 14929 / IAM 14863 / T) TaxID=292459 RepID=Q67N75_SYMTH|nr:LCP family protein [Symbiobacterium thermophilum]BAD40868.1 LytR family transcriptional regulator [Symbiobacterium thermophilum IAM 14863]